MQATRGEKKFGCWQMSELKSIRFSSGHFRSSRSNLIFRKRRRKGE